MESDKSWSNFYKSFSYVPSNICQDNANSIEN